MSASLVLKLSVFALAAGTSTGMECKGDNGDVVDWWAAVKYPDGSSYSYADASSPAFQKSSFDMSNANSGALSATLNQIYAGSESSTGYIFYNDESPDGKTWGTAWGHFKGVVGMTSSGGFWLVHSTPRIPATSPSSSIVSMCCSACPNSWNSVSTSLNPIRDGVSPTGGVPLQIRCTTGNLTSPSTILRSRQPAIQAPPRFSLGREYGSR